MASVNILIFIIALEHLGFLILEMFLWDKPTGLKVFKHDAEFAKRTKVMASNQGLYNGFLFAGLIWSLFPQVSTYSYNLQLFFLSCIVIAGLYGWYSVSKAILFVQALPALLVLLLRIYF